MDGHEDARRSIKLQLMISRRELQAIDDWRFRVRHASRAEAIRTLLARALAAETGGDETTGGTGNAS